MIEGIVVNEKDKNIIIYNLLSERYNELKECPHFRDEERFEQIESLMHLYKSKIEIQDLKR